MKMVAFAVKNWQLTLVLFAMIIIVGINTLLNMPRAEDPEINPPMFPVVVIYPGTSPKDMEELVVKPIEKKVSELEDIKNIETRIDDGVAVVTVEYVYTSNVNDKYQELVREINSIRDQLPPDLLKLEIRKVTPTDVKILQLALISENASMQALRTQANVLVEELEKIKSLKKVDYQGVQEQEVRIDLHMDKLARMRIPLNAVLGSIQSEAANIPGGSIRAGNNTYNIKTSGKYNTAHEVANTVVYNANGAIVYLKDVADVHLRYREETHIVRINGHRAVLVTAALKPGMNIAKAQTEYQSVINAFEQKLPANIALVRAFDQANNVTHRLQGLGIDFLIAIGLVLITLLPLGGRASLIVMIAIPLSLALGLISLNALGFSLNQLSIVGLVVALGLLVDDSIVVVENIERWLREGYTKRQAAIEATKQITLAVIGCTATLIVSFMPLAFMPEASGEFIRSLAVSVMAAVLGSMLVSLTIVPFLASRILKTNHSPDGNIFLRALQRIIKGSYGKLLEKSLRRPVTTLLVAAALFAGSLAVFGIIGFKLFPSSEKPQFLININMPLQSNIAATNQMVQRVEAELARVPAIKYYTSNTGKGNPRIYYNEIQSNEKSDFAQVYVQLNDDVNPSQKLDLIEELRARFLQYPGANIEVKDFEQGPPIEAPVAIRIIGNNLDTLRSLAAQTKSLLETIPGTIYARNEIDLLKSDIRVSINREKARTLGILTSDIDRTVRMAVNGLKLGTLSDEQKDEDYDIVVNAPRQGYATLQTLEGLFVNNAVGTPVPLNLVANLQFETSPVTINHIDKKRYAVVTAYVKKGALASDVLGKFLDKASQVRVPAGYTLVPAGEAESQQEAFGGSFVTVIILTVFLFITILILEFKTFKSTLIVLSVIPLGIIGGVLLLWATGNPMSFVAIVGFIGLAGIEVKNSILLVDFTNQLRWQGKGLDEAILEAGEIRFLPIVLTSLTAIGGLIPIALSSNPLISPLALVIIGGLISSTLLSRVVTPVVYKLIPPSIAREEQVG
jgi:multidrug efflux pump subunit AcrB